MPGCRSRTDRMPPLGEVAPGATWTVRLAGGQLAAGPTGGGADHRPVDLLASPRTPPTALVRINGREYHGQVVVVRDRTGLTAINVVPTEDYLAGVVAAEMGRRDSSEAEALASQAIVSRTFAIRNLGKRLAQGFDLYADGGRPGVRWGHDRNTRSPSMRYDVPPV